MMRGATCSIAAALALSMMALARAMAAPGYDPMLLPKISEVRLVDLQVDDSGPVRQIPIRVYLPASRSPAPVVLFSHGLGGSRESNPFMGEHWASRGYVAVFMQHPGSDDDIWRDKAVALRMGAMKQAATVENLLARVKDVH